MLNFPNSIRVSGAVQQCMLHRWMVCCISSTPPVFGLRYAREKLNEMSSMKRKSTRRSRMYTFRSTPTKTSPWGSTQRQAGQGVKSGPENWVDLRSAGNESAWPLAVPSKARSRGRSVLPDRGVEYWVIMAGEVFSLAGIPVWPSWRVAGAGFYGCPGLFLAA